MFLNKNLISNATPQTSNITKTGKAEYHTTREYKMPK